MSYPKHCRSAEDRFAYNLAERLKARCKDKDDPRAPKMVSMSDSGWTNREVGEYFEVHSERVRQILLACGRKGSDSLAMKERAKRGVLRKKEREAGIKARIAVREDRRGLPRGVMLDRGREKRGVKACFRAKVGPKIIGYFLTVDEAVAARAAAVGEQHG